MITATVRGFGWLLLLGGLFLMQAAAQPRISLQLQYSDFKGNLLRLADGHFVAERNGELFRLTSEGQFERKLDFAPDQPLAGITGALTYFERLVAPRNDGGFIADVTLFIQSLGWIDQRLASFDGEGRLVSSIDTHATFIPAAVELPDDRLLYASEDRVITVVQSIPGASLITFTLGFGGSVRAVVLQGSNVIVSGTLNFNGAAKFAGVTNGLWRLTDKLIPDGSFRPPRCRDVDQLAIQSDGRIIARGRLANAQGIFESDVSLFRMNSDGAFERSFTRAPADCCPLPLTFSVASNDEIIILNLAFHEETQKFLNEFSRYHADGTLAQSGVLGGDFIPFDAVELLSDGSFLAHWYFGDLGGGGCLKNGSRNHWVGFRPDGSIKRAFPPVPLDSVRIGISIADMRTGYLYKVEQSSDLIHWEDAFSGDDRWLFGGNGSVQQVFLGGCGIHLAEPRFVRVAEVLEPSLEVRIP
jgi:hypothetical protein